MIERERERERGREEETGRKSGTGVKRQRARERDGEREKSQKDTLMVNSLVAMFSFTKPAAPRSCYWLHMLCSVLCSKADLEAATSPGRLLDKACSVAV